MPRSTSPELAAYLQHRVREAIKAGRTATDLGKAAGLSTAQVSELKNKGIGAGWRTVEGLAVAFGMTLPEVFAAAEEWAKTQKRPASMPKAVAQDKRRDVAAELAREDGVSEAAIRSVLDEPLEGQDAQRSTVWWIMRIRMREMEMVGASREPAPSIEPKPRGRSR